MQTPVFSIVVPMYNEEPVIAESYRRLHGVMEGMGEPYELIFINDGSRDRSGAIVRELMQTDPNVRLIDFARNFGHQIAVTAGVDYARGDAMVIIDADLQDPPELIPQMAAKWREGYDVVYGQRARRDGDSAFKRLTAWGFYWLLNRLTNGSVPRDTGDFRLISRAVADVVRRMPEHNRFLRGIYAWVGFRQTPIRFERDKRWAGETKYPLRKMLRLASDGIYSFSVAPLKLASVLGIAATGLSLLSLLVCLIVWICGAPAPGLFVLASFNALLAGLILLCLGFVGAYVGRVYAEAQGRPLYIVAHAVGFPEDSNQIFQNPAEKQENGPLRRI